MQYNNHYSSDGFHFVQYQDLSPDDSLKVLSYRNDINVRKWMFSSKIISKENHFIFIEKLKTNNIKKYYAVFKKNRIVGSVYYDILADKEYSFGAFLNPSFLSTGIGLYFEYIYLKFFFKHLKAKIIKAEVLKDNISQISIHRLCNFNEYLSQNSKYYIFKFTDNDYNELPKNINDFVSELTINYKLKK